MCGADVDDYGCMGLLSGRHATGELAALKNRLRTLLGLWSDRATTLSPDDEAETRDEFAQAQAVTYWTCVEELRVEVEQ